MKKTRLIIALLLTALLAFGLVACGNVNPPEGEKNADENPTEESFTYTVQIAVSDPDAVDFVGENRKTVSEGEDAVFEIHVKNAYKFVSTSHGTYDEATKKLTVPSVTKNIRVNFEVQGLGYDPTEVITFDFRGADKDTCSAGWGIQEVNLGTKITLTAGDKKRVFVGWSYGARLRAGGTLITSERSCELSIIPSVIDQYCTKVGEEKILAVYANYNDANVYHYDPNGGTVNTSSTNMKGNKYYTASFIRGVVTVNVGDVYMDFAECVSTFWDDGTFSREGYVLAEYNTEPDGSGEGYSLGSKFYAPSTYSQTLYCIWEKATEASDFEYEDVTWEYADGVTETTAPHWQINGIKITKYNGDAKTVVIPEKINGKHVTAIDKGAFVNKSVEVLVFNRFILRVEDGAFVGCSSLHTLYMNDSIFYMNDEAFDTATYTNFKHLYLNATMAPRFTADTHGDSGVFSVKFSRLLASQSENRIIVVAGSSTYQGLGSEYLEALLEGEYTVINLGTTRTVTGMIFLEMLQHYTHEGDIVIMSPENHVNMFGNNIMWYRPFRDLEGMYNVFRYIDISNYPKFFTALSSYNAGREYGNGINGNRYCKAPHSYEDMAAENIKSNKYGDFQQAERGYFCEESKTKYIDSYFITLNRFYKNDLNWKDVEYQEQNKDYLTSDTWTDFTIYKDEVNRVIGLVQKTGAKVYFGFAPVDGREIITEAQNAAWLDAYDKLIEDNYEFDGLVGSCKNYIYDHKYMFDCAYHVNDYGRTYRTYQLYVDLCEILGIEDVNAHDEFGTNFEGCLFEDGSDGTPVTKVDYLSNSEVN